MLGKGGMGEVYEAEQTDTGRTVALKTLNHSLGGAENRARFLREGRLAASLSHPNTVYVYGTEEVDGVPLITMELVPGGTLKDLVAAGGPMKVREAVDAIVQAIDGLAASAAKGVLHRDIKPSNCFVDRDGKVKIGDFGLSMSTLARPESHLTTTGTFLGTPAFASPEQIRGGDVDVRSDIYSVGATLYYLITGRPPFDEQHAGKLFAQVLERPPESPRQFRPEVPSALERVTLRCLAKNPESRYPDYASLRAELAPLGSEAASPATLRLRALAGAMDWALLALIGVPFSGGPPEASKMILKLATVVLYFTLLEGLRGASLGKTVFGLRVAGPDSGPPGLGRAALRTSVFVMPGLAFFLSLLDLGGRVVFPGFGILLFALLFVTARRRNGYAALQDLASGTRVVRRPVRIQPRPAAQGAPLGWVRSAEKPVGRIGAYPILERLWECEGEELLLGVDEQLRREVWIRVLPAGSPPFSAQRRDLARPGRLRWHDGSRSPDGCWDVWEAPEGRPLRQKVTEKPPWSAAGLWLFALAEEVNEALKDGSLPSVLALDRVWVAPDGRARLLDFPAPGSAPQPAGASEPTKSDLWRAQDFLGEVGATLMSGPVPLAVRAFKVETAGLKTPDVFLSRLRELLDQPPADTRQLRLNHLLSGGSLALILWVAHYAAFNAGAKLGPESAGPRELEAVAVTALTIAAAGLYSGLFFRGGLSLRAFGLAVVEADGAKPSVLKAVGRSLVAWSPFWILAAVSIFALKSLPVQLAEPVIYSTAVACALIFLGGAVYAGYHPERSLQDRIAGTYLVPR